MLVGVMEKSPSTLSSLPCPTWPPEAPFYRELCLSDLAFQIGNQIIDTSLGSKTPFLCVCTTRLVTGLNRCEKQGPILLRPG